MPPARDAAPGSLALEYMAEIAVGPTARVDLCRATSPDGATSLVAVKRLHAAYAEDPQFVSRFLDEAWMTAALKHPNVVELSGWGTDAAGTYLAVELVQGVSLARLRKTVFETREEFTERMVVYVGACICRGLVAAHSLRSQGGEPLQLVHRDLTLDNVLVGFNGDVKIADFGLAKAKLRLTPNTVGISARPTLQMAPEEVTGKVVDHRMDLFALGILLFELLARRPPWTGTNEIEILQQIVADPAPELADLRPRIDREIAAIVMRCLEKDPDARFPTAAAALQRLDDWLFSHGYALGNAETLARFVRRNGMKQMRWFEQAIAGAPQIGLEKRTPKPEMPRFAAPSSPGVDASAAKRTEATAVARPARAPVDAPEEVATAELPRRPSRSMPAVPDSVASVLRERTHETLIRELPEEDVEEIEIEEDEYDAPTLIQKRTGAGLDAVAPKGKGGAAFTRARQGKPPRAAPIDDPPSSEADPTVRMRREDMSIVRRPQRSAPGVKIEVVSSTTSVASSKTMAEQARLRAFADRCAEEARACASAAERASAAAKVAEAAAALAAEAVQLEIRGSSNEASELLDRARALEASVAGRAGPPRPRSR